MAGQFIRIGGEGTKEDKRIRRRVEKAVSPNPNRKAVVSAVTGQSRRGDSGLSLWRSQMQGTMMSMFLDPKNGMDYGAISRRINEIAVERGYDYVVTKGMVAIDVRKAIEEEIRRHEGERDSVHSAAVESLKAIVRNCWADYEDSKRVDAKSEASMLRTLIKDAGMSYEEAMVEIQSKRYSGNPDHFRVAMDALGRLASLYGISMRESVSQNVANTGSQQNQTGNIINYNFGEADKDLMRDIVRKLQDRKTEEVLSESGEEKVTVDEQTEDTGDE